jgi:hypothetical protein
MPLPKETESSYYEAKLARDRIAREIASVFAHQLSGEMIDSVVSADTKVREATEQRNKLVREIVHDVLKQVR